MTMQLKRGDLVKLALANLREQAGAEVRAATAAEQVERDKFVRRMRAEVLVNHSTTLERLCSLCGTTTARLIADVHLEPTDDVLTSPPHSVSMTLRDDEPYAARVVLRLKVDVVEHALMSWLDAVKRKQTAEARGLKTKDLGDDARAKMVDDLLTVLPEGRAALAALADFTKAVKDHED